MGLPGGKVDEEDRIKGATDDDSAKQQLVESALKNLDLP